MLSESCFTKILKDLRKKYTLEICPGYGFGVGRISVTDSKLNDIIVSPEGLDSIAVRPAFAYTCGYFVSTKEGVSFIQPLQLDEEAATFHFPDLRLAKDIAEEIKEIITPNSVRFMKDI